MYWLYHGLSLHIIGEHGLVDEVNLVKRLFAESLGDAQRRASLFREKLISANAAVLFTQEGDLWTEKALTEQGDFWSVQSQTPGDGCFVFLRRSFWKENYEVHLLKKYEGAKKGRINVVLAETVEGQRFLLASAHGNSTNAADGREQISHVVQLYHQLKEEDEQLKLLIGMDANTKTEEDVEKLQEHLVKLGLMSTRVGPTTVKRRMITAQHSKAGKLSIDEEDYLISLKEEGTSFENVTVGFREEKPSPTRMLPDLDNPSDHYPVGANFILNGFSH